MDPDKDERRSRLHGPYRRLVQAFIAGGDEAQLYEASILARTALHDGLGPEDVVQIHAGVLDSLLAEQGAEHLARFVSRSSALLLEMMVVYAEAHQHARELLATLERNYHDLDETRRALERSQDELRDKTAQLVQTGKMTALGELSAGLVHEVNQPLNAINIIVQDVRRDLQRHRLDLESLAPSLGDIADQVRRIADIVAHLRIYTRRMEAAPERLDITVPIEGVFKILGEQLRVRGIDVVKELAPGLAVVGDAIRLEQVFMNLVINARDALEQTARGAPKRIVLRTFARAAHVVIEVEDNGCGVAEDVRGRIFEPFFTTKQAGHGTGLGLSISKQIVEEHQGELQLESTADAGTTFRLLLPVAPPRTG